MSSIQPPEPAAQITVVLIAKAATALEAYTARTGLSNTDAVNRAIQFLEDIDKETSQGAKLLLQRADGTRYEVAQL